MRLAGSVIDVVHATIPTTEISLDVEIWRPDRARRMILCAHDGTPEPSLRLRHVAHALTRAGSAILLVNPLAGNGALADAGRRLGCVADWVRCQPIYNNFAIASFALQQAAPVGLLASTERPLVVGAVVSWGGHPEYAGAALSRIATPTLFLASREDAPAAETAYNSLPERIPRRLTILPDSVSAPHRFDTLTEVATLACQWFDRHLTLPEVPPVHQLAQTASVFA